MKRNHTIILRKLLSSVLLTLIIILQSLVANAQRFDWLKGSETQIIGGPTDSRVIADAAGYFYAVGIYRNKIYLGTDSLGSYGGNSDIYIAKFDSTGNRKWLYPIGANGTDDVYGLAADGAGRLYISFYSYFGSTVQLHDTIMNISGYNLLCIDTSGKSKWIKAGYTESNFYLAASLTSPGIYATQGKTIYKIDELGNTVWLKTATLNGINGANITAIGVNNNGQFAVTFKTNVLGSGSMTYDSVTVAVSNVATGQVVYECDKSGSAYWGREFSKNVTFRVKTVRISNANNAVYIGAEGGNATLYFANDTIVNPSSPGKDWGTVLKYNNSGTPVWARAYYAGDQGSNAYLADLIINAADEIVFCGYFANSSQCSFGPFNLPFNGSQAIVAKLSASGNYMWAKMDPRAESSSEHAYHITCVNGYKYVIGGDLTSGFPFYEGCHSFSPGTFSGAEYYTIISENMEVKAGFTTNAVSPNVFNFTDQSIGASTWSWLFPGATPSTSNSQNPTSITYSSPGNYVVTLNACNSFCCDTFKLTLSKVGIGEINSVGSELNIYPNPASKNVIVSLSGSGSKEVAVTIKDFTGKTIYTTTTDIDKIEVDTRGFAPGIYIVKFESKEFKIARKFVVQDR